MPAIKECLKCSSLEVKGLWYPPHRAPAHEPILISAICPKCKEKIENRKVENAKTSH